MNLQRDTFSFDHKSEAVNCAVTCFIVSRIAGTIIVSSKSIPIS
ncbi:hypothetical protein LEP1GSC055_2266 [Leptospira borgpetersenii str. Brem 307]|nr:hypothetical protein LEP1GSC055_2266 [Leptospira borgpetersenii str. Brem 307]